MNALAVILAEVSDKVPTIAGIWYFSALLSLACLFFMAWRRHAALVVLPVVVVWAFIITSEIRDPNLGPAIASELGRGYVTQTYIAAATPLIFAVIGFFRCKHHVA